MKRLIIQIEAMLLASVIITSSACRGGTPSSTLTTNSPASNTEANAANTTETSNVEVERFNPDEMDELLARVALYPDPLLAQVIPASTFIDQLKDARGTLNGSTDESQVDNQDWDVSVRSVAHYPSVLNMMVEDEDWITTLGQAYVLQPEDVGESIQRLRGDAMDVGNLFSGPQQEVIDNGEDINIYPAQPKTVYVPEYNSETVYTEPRREESEGNSTGAAAAPAAIAFGAGLPIGSWLNKDYDYDDRGIYYHGWAGGAQWVNTNAEYVDANRSVYVSSGYSNISLNRNVVNQRGSTAYRKNLTLNSSIRRSRMDNARDQ